MAQDKLDINPKGLIASHFTRDNAASPFTFPLIVIGVFSYFTSIYWLFIVSAVFVVLLIGWGYIFDDRKNRSEKYNLEYEKIARMGSKDEENITEGEVVQPVLQTRRQQINAKANIAKKAES